MLKDALTWLRELVETAAKTEVLREEPRKVIFWDRANGRIDHFDKEPDPRKHVVVSLDSLVKSVEKFATDGTIWLSAGAVTVIIDDATRFDRVVLPLEFSQQFKRIKSLEQAQPMTQKSLIWLLRHELSGACSPHLVPLFRKMDFKRSSDGSSTIDHGRESLGRAVESAVCGTADLPETIAVTCPVFWTPGCQAAQEVPLDLDIDTASERFMLVPRPDATNKAVQTTLESMAESIVHELGDDWTDRIFFGTP